ncbi:MAG: cob(I)yrinic acid a,c-diamide adenosyltransferase [Sulfolobales archaeon]
MKKVHLGDEGFTSIFYGVKIPKEDPLIELLGELDELNSLIGFARSVEKNSMINDLLKQIQSLIFRMSRDLAIPVDRLDNPLISKEDIDMIERKTIELWESIREPRFVFVYPTGSQAASIIHVARSVCRRAERTASKLYHDGRIKNIYLVLLNRLSDLLFVLARYTNQINGFSEEFWSP